MWSFLSLTWTLLVVSSAWNSGDLQMFDLVDEVKMSFYDFLNIEKTASVEEIRRAYRRLSVQMHPDKNTDDPTASEKFRQLVGIYEILKDSQLRERYDDVLENGLPDWRNAVFYYRKLRRMSNAELFFLFATLSTTIHYAVLWGSRFERSWNLEEQLSTAYKRHKAKDKKREAIDTQIAEKLREIPRPRWHDVLPFAICKTIYSFVLSVPPLCVHLNFLLWNRIDQYMKERMEQQEVVEMQAAKERAKSDKQERKRRIIEQKLNEPTPYHATSLASFLSLSDIPSEKSDDKSNSLDKAQANKEWSEDDIVNLVHAVARFPGGFPDRWGRIAGDLGRPISEVITKVKQLGENTMQNMCRHPVQTTHETPIFETNLNAVCGESSEEEEPHQVEHNHEGRGSPHLVEKQDHPVSEVVQSTEDEVSGIYEPYISRKKQKQQRKQMASCKQMPFERALFADSSDNGWTQVEQKQLEVGIRSIDKSTPERWDRIAECVPTKTKTEVMQRVKYLSTVVKSKTLRR